MTINPDSSSTVFPAQNAGLCVGEHYEVEGSTTRSYYYLGGQRIAMRVDDGQSSDVYWFHSDHLGSTSTLSDINGNEVVTSTVRFYPYGEYRVTPTSDLTDKGFTGHAQNDEVALIYMRARYYVPGVGRFASADTIVPDPAEPPSLNRYAYVNCNPLLSIDPTGHWEIEGVGAIVPLPWTFTNEVLDLNGDGVITDKEALRSYDYYQTNAYRIFAAEMEMPVRGFVPDLATNNSAFGGHNTLGGLGYHAAIDIGGAEGTPIYSTGPGTIVDIVNDPNADLGCVVVVEHNVFGVQVFTVYAHLEENSTVLQVGGRVGSYSQLGGMGQTGTNNVHLHFEARTAMNVVLDEAGDYSSFPRSADSYWANSEEELVQKWVDLGPRFGYSSVYPWSRYRLFSR